VIDGKNVRGARHRATGLGTNAALRIDPVLGDMCLPDPIGGYSSLFDLDLKVKVVAA
jgi:tetrathionate reductase subunit A